MRLRDRARRPALEPSTTRSRSTPGATRSAACRGHDRGVPLRGARRDHGVRPSLAGRRLPAPARRSSGRATGSAGDADPTHRAGRPRRGGRRHADDPLYARTVARRRRARSGGTGGSRRCRCCASAGAAPTRSRFPLCLSARLADDGGARPQRVGRARQRRARRPRADDRARRTTPDDLPRRRPARAALPRAADDGGRPATVAVDADDRALRRRPRATSPATSATRCRRSRCSSPTPTDAGARWTPVPDLLDSTRSTSTSSRRSTTRAGAILRFGDDEYGRELRRRRPRSRAVYRVGNGRAGNVGARDADRTIALPASPAPGITPSATRSPAAGGVDAETDRGGPPAARPRRSAPSCSAPSPRTTGSPPPRSSPGVSGAVATFRWTGSWYTIFVAVDPSDRADLVDLPDGRTRLEPALRAARPRLPHPLPARRLRHRAASAALRRRSSSPSRSARGTATSAPTSRGAVRDALSARVLPDGTRGFFHPTNFTFGDPRLPQPALRGGRARRGRRLRRDPQADALRPAAARELDSGVLPIGPWEIVRLDNDPSFVEHGVLTVTARGGKA